MARRRSRVRRSARSNPQGILKILPDGYGFVHSAEGEYFISSNKLNGAFDGDLVELAPLARNAGRGSHRTQKASTQSSEIRPAARVLRVIERSCEVVVGRYEVAEPFGVVVPEDPRIPYDIFTMRSERPDIPDGSIVTVRIVTFPDRHSAATGIVEDVLGMADDERALIDLIVARHKIETTFSPASLDEARVAKVDVEAALSEGYRDIRDRFVFTVDPADAKDFDDAVSLERLDTGKGHWRLGVHIADVSHYVPWNSSLDLDARRRATSVYLVDRVIPMLPHELSDDVCSLRPDEDRLSMTVDIYLDESGHILSTDMYPAVIQSKARLTYEQAQEILEGTANQLSFARSSLEDELPWRLKELLHLAKLRAGQRGKHGGIDFVSKEAKVRLDEEGCPISIDVRVKTDATELIEEAMILANEAVASRLHAMGFPVAFRVHEAPDLESLAGLVPIFQEFAWYSSDMGFKLGAGAPQAIQRALLASRGRPEEELVSSLLLRAMKRAVYKPENLGHFALSSEAYCHFTSPIRRYPDLIVHRMLRASLTKRGELFDQEVSSLGWLCEHASKMERVAEEAARESQECKMIELLQSQVGKAFPAIVSGVTARGLFVRLECTAEGFLPIRCLGEEYFEFDASKHLLFGQDSATCWRLGQRIAVVIVAAEPTTRTLEFRLA